MTSRWQGSNIESGTLTSVLLQRESIMRCISSKRATQKLGLHCGLSIRNRSQSPYQLRRLSVCVQNPGSDDPRERSNESAKHRWNGRPRRRRLCRGIATRARRNGIHNPQHIHFGGRACRGTTVSPIPRRSSSVGRSPEFSRWASPDLNAIGSRQRRCSPTVPQPSPDPVGRGKSVRTEWHCRLCCMTLCRLLRRRRPGVDRHTHFVSRVARGWAFARSVRHPPCEGLLGH